MNPCDRCQHALVSHKPGGCVECPPQMRCTSYKVPFPASHTVGHWLGHEWMLVGTA